MSPYHIPTFMQKCASFIALLLIVIFVCSVDARRQKPLIDNGYHVLVGIHKSVKEDSNILNNLKDILTQASTRVYNGTKQRAYIRSVSILLPSSWSHKSSYHEVGKERFADADIVVRKANAKFGNTPYTKGLSVDCGAPGEFIHLTPSYVNDKDGARKYFGDAGKVFLHEWGQFRWGLKEEYPDPFGSLGSKFYYSTKTGKYEAVRCSLATKGRVLQPMGNNKYRPCILKDGMPDHKDCQFYPGFKIDNMARVSVMDRQGTDKVDGFCESSSDPLHEHNLEAPNSQNVHCGGRSAWEVMIEHPDFKDGNNPKREISDLTPEFRILHNKNADKNCRISLVVDRSGSMSGSKIRDLKNGLIKFVKYTVRDGTQIGISSFSTRGSIDCPMRDINNEADREAFVRSCLGQRATGGTSIGAGLLKGVENLGADTKGSRIFILTDGAQTTNPGPRNPNVINALDKANVYVDAVCFTANADKDMTWLASNYGGKFYFDNDKATSNSLNEAFLKHPCGESNDDTGKGIPLLSSAGIIMATNKSVGGHFFIDNTIGKDTKFLISYGMNGNLGTAGVMVNVTAPNGDSYGEGMPEYELSTSLNSIVINIPDKDALPGKWSFKIMSRFSGDQSYTINVISSYRSSITPFAITGNSGPIILKAYVKDLEVAFPNPMAVFAEATRGDDAVLNLAVTASVDRPTSDETFRLTLKDDGLGPDVEKDDGIYSGLFADYDRVGRYSFSVMAENGDGTAAIKSYVKPGNWGSAPLITEDNIDLPQKPEFELVKLKGGISRTATAGAAEMVAGMGITESDLNGKLARKEDLIPPMRIIDLEVLTSSISSFSMAWTAPGDNWNTGKVDTYKINIQFQFDGGDFKTTLKQTAEAPAGERVVSTVKLTDFEGIESRPGLQAFVVAVDAAGNESPASNLVSTKLSVIDDKDGKDVKSLTVVVVVVAIACIVVFVAVVAVIVVKKKQNSRVSSQRFDNEAGL